ncbi:hypothetical protein AUF78_18230 [archaeon 13_1_20CM_2_51_12]|nr:MAG: hypothetical protein AUF78_18230 [archaeon 13_1_20CM_2_51_12]
MMLLLRVLKISDSAVLGDKSRIFRGRWFRQEIDRSLMVYKKNISRDTKVLFEREMEVSMKR